MAINTGSLTVAKNTCIEALIAKTGGAQKKNAFQGFLPPTINTYSTFFSGGDDVANTWNAPITEFRMNCDLAGYFVTQPLADVFIMQIMSALPVRNSGNVFWFRLRAGGNPLCELRPVKIGNDTRESAMWVVQMGLEMVFDTTSVATP